MKKTENLELNKPDYDDFADIAPINDNMDKIDSELKKLEIEAKNKDGGNADMVDGKHASDFTGYKVFNSENELRESDFQGYFKIKDTGRSDSYRSGISLITTNTDDEAPLDRTNFQNYVRLIVNKPSVYFDKNIGLIVCTDILNLKAGVWAHNSNNISLEGHTHTGYDVEHDEVSVSGNKHSITKSAGTLRSFMEDIYTRLLKAESISVNNEGKSTADYAEYAWDANKLNGKAYENFVTNRIYSTKEDLNNPSFDKAFITFTTDASVIPNTSEGSSGYWHIMHFPFSNGCSTQFAMPFGTNKVYTRSSENSKWSDWVSLISSEGGTMSSSEGDKSYSVSLNSKRLYVSDNYCNNTSEDGDRYESIEDNYSAVITGKNITVSNSSHQRYFDDEISDEVTITPTGISHTGDSTATITGFDIEGYERVRNVTTAVDWNTLNATGFYHIRTQEGTNRPVTHHGLLYVDKTVGTPFQIFIPDGNVSGIYKRSLSSNTWTNITDFPTSLPADGGNADTVDGKHASDLQNYNNLTNKPTSLKNPYSLTIQGNGTILTNGTYDGSASKTVNITPSSIGAAPYSVRVSGDFNNMVTPGIYTMRSTTANAPTTGSYYGLIVLESDDNSDGYIEQIAFKESSYEVYIRFCSSYDDEAAEYSWSAWKKLALAPIIQAESFTNITTIDSSLSNGDILMLYS